MIFTHHGKSHNGHGDALYTNQAWFMENRTGSSLLWSPAGKADVYLEGNFMTSALTQANICKHIFCAIKWNIMSPCSVCRCPDLRSAVGSHSKYREISQTDHICCKTVLFPKDLSPTISVRLFFPQLLFLFKCGKSTSIVPFLPCLYLFHSVNSVVLTPLHGLRKLSLQRTAIPRSITGPFRSSHRGLLAEKLCWYGFQQASGENEAASQKTSIITRSHLSACRRHIVVEGSAHPDDPWRRAAGGGSSISPKAT